MGPGRPADITTTAPRPGLGAPCSPDAVEGLADLPPTLLFAATRQAS